MNLMSNPGRKTAVFAFCILTTLFTAFNSNAQVSPVNLPSVAPPSPEAASLGKYGDIPVSYHTGVPNISIPLYQLKDGDVTLPISLSYHASGIRVSEVAPWVGIGWALNAGGVITRSVQHGPDEGPLPNSPSPPPGLYFGSPTPSYHTGYYRDGFTLPPNYENVMSFDPNMQGFTKSTWNKMMDAAQGNSDTEPDIFFYNIGGYSGKFLFKVDVNETTGAVTARTPVFIPKADIKVEVTYGNLLMPVYPSGTETRETFIGFTLTTPDGFKYYFGGDANAIEFTGSQIFNQANYTSSTSPKLSPSSWYLKKIESPNGRKIDLIYRRDKYGYYDLAPEQIWGAPIEEYLTFTNQMISRSVVAGLKLDTIRSSTEEILFKAETIRQDLSNFENYGGGEQINQRTSAQLDRIEINKKDHTPVKKFLFSYDYMEGLESKFPFFLEISAPDKAVFTTDKLRLKLNAVTETSGDGLIALPPYQFTYFYNATLGAQNQQLPRRISFQQDHWGYYNGQTMNNSLIAFWRAPRKNHRDTDAQKVKFGTLSSIKYPTGGTTTFTYETHEGVAGMANVDNPDLGRNYVADSWSATGNGGTSTVEYSTQAPLVMDSNSPCVVLGWECNVFQMMVKIRSGSPTGGTYDLGTDANLRTSTAVEVRRKGDDYLMSRFEFGWIEDCAPGESNCSNTTGTTPGQYFKEMTRTFPITLPPGDYYSVAYRREGTRSGQTYPYLLTADVDINIDSERDPNYRQSANVSKVPIGGLRIKSILTSDGTSASPNQEKVYTYPSTGGQLFSRPEYFYQVKFLFNSWPDLHAVNGSICELLWSSSSIIPMRTTQGNHIGYAWVKEAQVGNGYKTYSYDVADHSYQFSDPWFQGNTFSYEAPGRRYSYPVYPAPLDLQKGNLLSEEVFNNGDKKVMATYNTYEAADNMLTFRASKVGFIRRQVGEEIVSYVAYTHYPVYTAISRIKQSDVYTNYDAAGLNPTNVLTLYNYDSQNHLQATSVVKRTDNVEYVDNFIYPPDYGAITATTGGVKKLQEKNVINVPVEKYTVKRATGSNSGSVINATLTRFRTDKPLQDTVLTLKLTAPLLETSFNKSNRIAAAFNPDARYEKRLVYHAYDTKGNITEVSKNQDSHVSYVWDYAGTRPTAEVKNAAATQVSHTSFEDLPNSFSSTAITGKKSYSGTGYAVLFPSTGTFTLTYWRKVGSADWEYMESTVTGASGATAATLGTSGTLIDEVRLFPAGAQMTTYTYDVSFGVTSITDANNKITYFEYDKLGRLEVVRDQERNILRTYTYNYAK